MIDTIWLLSQRTISVPSHSCTRCATYVGFYFLRTAANVFPQYLDLVLKSRESITVSRFTIANISNAFRSPYKDVIVCVRYRHPLHSSRVHHIHLKLLNNQSHFQARVKDPVTQRHIQVTRSRVHYFFLSSIVRRNSRCIRCLHSRCHHRRGVPEMKTDASVSE